jgi:HAD superfamily hydrolase (TIGR01548 family)
MPHNNNNKSYATVLLDMDGVLAEVSKSYRVAIERTCHAHGAISVTQQLISEWKVRGNANCDWTLSHNLIKSDPNGDPSVTFDQVKQTFEDLYQGTDTVPGLCQLETLIPSRQTLDELKLRSRGGIGIVTGRPRSDCDAFLRDHLLEDFVDASVCAEDGPNKPDPFPVLKCCQLLGVEPSPLVVLVGDTPDDVRAALSAGCSAVGVLTPEAMIEGEEELDVEAAIAASPLARAMQDAGVDAIFKPGFEDLVGRMM